MWVFFSLLKWFVCVFLGWVDLAHTGPNHLKFCDDGQIKSPIFSSSLKKGPAKLQVQGQRRKWNILLHVIFSVLVSLKIKMNVSIQAYLADCDIGRQKG